MRRERLWKFVKIRLVIMVVIIVILVVMVFIFLLAGVSSAPPECSPPPIPSFPQRPRYTLAELKC